MVSGRGDGVVAEVLDGQLSKGPGTCETRVYRYVVLSVRIGLGRVRR